MAINHELGRYEQRNVTRTCMNVIDPSAALAAEMVVVAVSELEARVFAW